ncbi:hypothetical protein KCU95_g7037, partial [Aureobasidium melanogenum]
MNVDLSAITSDGTGRYPPNMQRPDLLSQVFNMNGHGSRLFGFGHNVNFIGTLPQGYAAFNNTTPAGHTMVELWGHPHGYAFTFVRDFSVHVVSDITASLVGCRCTLCVVPCPSSEGSSASLYEGRDSTPYSSFPVTPPATDDSVSVQVIESD